ncbi:MAG: FAD-dependent monooxygenase [Chroococcidiopsidaceae cyanobacterium CP_BM_RX_35]|nr:FAD-dependent monooxygenase [Chroococcidiopsidaceae cyanobacterium CP_BM_RX_35]
MREVKPVLIVGAGPTGMTAAMELSRFGVPVRIVDKLATPSTTSRALAVQARTLELFEQRGLIQEMLQIGNQGTEATIYGNGKRLGKVHLTEIKSRYNFILLLSQSETERILREELARQGVAIEHGTEMIEFAQLESSAQPGLNSGVKAVLRNSEGGLEELEAAYLISAEGAHSMVRRTLNLQFQGKSLQQSYALADLHLDGDLPDNELSIFTAAHGFLGVFPMGNRHFRFIATEPEKHEKTDDEPTLAELQKIYDEDSHIPARLRDMTWSSRFRINSRMLHTLRERRMFLGGDAAHIHSPAGGQGMNTGIQDMINLSWKLAMVWQGKATPELLNTYEEERLPIIRSIVSRTETATDVLNSNSPIVHQLITHIAPVLLNAHFVQQLSTGLISEVAANYRASSLSQTHHARGSLRAGDRVPDMDVIVRNLDSSEDTQPRKARLYEILAPSRFNLLVAGSESTMDLPPIWEAQLSPWHGFLKIQHIAPVPTQGEAMFQFDSSFGNGQSLALVRPDSYLGFVGNQDALSALTEWLSRWFPPTAN